MVEPKDLSVSELKNFHKAVREKIECANDSSVKVEGWIVLGLIDEELNDQGYDVQKLFKGYVPH